MTKVKLFGVLRDRAERDEVAVPPGKTIWEILGLLGEKYGAEVRNLLIEEKDGELQKRHPVVILINGISQVDLERVIGDGEVLSIFPAVAGGKKATKTRRHRNYGLRFKVKGEKGLVPYR